MPTMKTRNWLKSLILLLSLCILTAAQSTPPNPAPSPDNGNINFSDTMRRLTRQAVEIIPAFTRTVETPLGGYFDTLAFYLAWLIAIGFFFKTYRENNGMELEDLLWYWARVACCLALLSYCGDINRDGLRGDLYNKLGHMGNSLAYGTVERDFEDSFIGTQVLGAKDVFADNYRDFVHGKFMYKVNNED